MAGEIPWPTNISEYIQGHLSRYSIGEQVEGPVTWALHLDTILMSWLLAGIGFYFFYKIGKSGTVKAPSKTQVFCELVIGFFDNQVRDLFPHAPRIVGPLAVTIFIWVLLMNSMDLIPVDLIAATGYLLTGSVPHFKLLPTADLSVTLALALSVFALIIYYNIKVKGVGGLLREMASQPFGLMWAPFNIGLRLIEEIAKPLSLSMRLFGNLFAAEMIFLLIAGISFIGAGAFLAQWLFSAPWLIYHILVVPLQAYIFAVLTIVYLSMACEHH